MVYSIIVPVYRSEDVVRETVIQICKSMDSWALEYEIILVNDGSPDNSWEVIKSLAIKKSQVVSINLLKNFGQHSAVLCGMSHAKGDYLITMDDDLQNPPQELIKLINKISEGYDLVFARFHQKKHAFYRKLGTQLVDYVNRKVFDKPKGIVLTNFRIFHKDVAQLAVNYKTYYPYIPGLLLMHSSRIGNVYTEHHKREIGESNYSIGRIVKLMSRLLFNYSSYPLRLLVQIGGVTTIFSFLLGVYVVVNALTIGSAVPGWSSIIVLLSFFNGVLIGTLGVIGIYVSRILRELSGSHSFIVKEIIGH